MFNILEGVGFSYSREGLIPTVYNPYITDITLVTLVSVLFSMLFPRVSPLSISGGGGVRGLKRQVTSGEEENQHHNMGASKQLRSISGSPIMRIRILCATSWGPLSMDMAM